mgnify:CR=1 FL=1
MSILNIEKVSFAYSKKKNVLKDLDLIFEKGSTYAIMGRSGAGKTTLLSLISGLEPVREGKILYNGRNISELDRENYRKIGRASCRERV